EVQAIGAASLIGLAADTKQSREIEDSRAGLARARVLADELTIMRDRLLALPSSEGLFGRARELGRARSAVAAGLKLARGLARDLAGRLLEVLDADLRALTVDADPRSHAGAQAYGRVAVDELDGHAGTDRFER